MPAASDAAIARMAEEPRSSDDWRWFWGALGAAAAPMLVPYFAGLWRRDHYQFFPLALVAVAVLAYGRSDGRFGAPRGPAGWTILAAGSCLLAGSLWLGSPWLAAAGCLLFAAVCLASLRGPRDASLLSLALPLAILLRPPMRYDQVLVAELQGVTTQLTSVALDVLAVPHALSGNVIRLPDRELLVAEACSGIQSVFTLAFLASLIVVCRRRWLWTAPIYLAVAVVLAVGANVLRVGAVAVGQSWWAVDLAVGWAHAAVGYTALALAAACLVSLDALIVALLHPVQPVTRDDRINPIWRLWNSLVADELGRTRDRHPAGTEETSTGRLPVLRQRSRLPHRAAESGGEGPGEGRIRRLTRYAVVALAAGVMVVSVVQASRLIPGFRGHSFLMPQVLFTPPPDLPAGAAESLEVVEHTVARDGATPRLGTNADLWQCRVGRHPAQLVLSQTYRGWHELCFCYQNNGWRVLRRQAVRPDAADEAPASAKAAAGESPVPVALARFARDGRPGRAGYLFYTALTADGRAVAPPQQPGALRRRFLDTEDHRPMMMLQLWIVAEQKLAAARIEEIKDDFFDVRKRIAQAMVRPEGGTADRRE